MNTGTMDMAKRLKKQKKSQTKVLKRKKKKLDKKAALFESAVSNISAARTKTRLDTNHQTSMELRNGNVETESPVRAATEAAARAASLDRTRTATEVPDRAASVDRTRTATEVPDRAASADRTRTATEVPDRAASVDRTRTATEEPTRPTTVVRMTHPQEFPPVKNRLAAHATVLFSLAAFLGLLLIFAALYLPEGIIAVRAMSGFPQEGIPVETAQIFLALDTLFPAFLLSGIAVLATALQLRGNRMLVVLVLITVMMALISDMAENALVFDFINGRGLSNFQFPFTVVKFGSIAFASIMFSAILPRIGKLVQIVNGLLRYGLPAAIAVVMTQIGIPELHDAFGVALVVTILILAFYSQTLAEPE